jgi:hypothetical protein
VDGILVHLVGGALSGCYEFPGLSFALSFVYIFGFGLYAIVPGLGSSIASRGTRVSKQLENTQYFFGTSESDR